MGIRIAGFACICGLLVAILVAVIVQGNRILGAIPYPPDVQDVHVVNTGNDRIPVALPEHLTTEQETKADALAAKYRQAVKQWGVPGKASSSH